MVLFEIGRVCVKSRGREAGARCVVVDVIDKNFVLVSGLGEEVGMRRRRSNVDHLNPTELKLEIKKGASDEEVKETYAKVAAAASKGEAEEAPAPSAPKKKRGKEKGEKPSKAKAPKKTPAQKEPPQTEEVEE